MLFNICYLLIYLLANTVALLRSMSICMLQQGGTAKALHLNEQLLTLGMVCMLIHSNNQSICTVSAVTLGGAYDGGVTPPVGLQGHVICGSGRYRFVAAAAA